MVERLTIKKHHLFGILLVIFLSVLSTIITNEFVNSFTSRVTTYFLIGILGLLAFGPILHRIAKHSFDLAEPGIWFALYYFTHFGMRAIYDLIFGSPVLGFEPESVNFGLVNAALGVSIFGLLAFWVGYYTPLGKAFANSFGMLPRKWNQSRALQIAILCTAFGWSFRIFLIFYQAGGIGNWLAANKYVELAQTQGTTYLSILSSVATVGLLIYFILARVFRKCTYWFLFSMFLVPELTFRFVSGSRAQFIFLLLGLLICLYMTSKRDYKTTMRYSFGVAILIILFIFLYPLFSIIRGGIRDSEEILLRTSNFWENPVKIFYLIGSRQVGLDSLALIIDYISKGEPYTLGSELKLAAISWISRKIWLDKPIISLGKIFYEKFYPPIFHEGTSVAVTLPGEFYWAFGFVGVIIGMLIIGVLWRFLFEYLVCHKENLSNILVVSFMFPSFFILMEQTLVSLLTVHLPQFIIAMIVSFILHRRIT